MWTQTGKACISVKLSWQTPSPTLAPASRKYTCRAAILLLLLHIRGVASLALGCSCRLLCLLARNRMQQFHQIDCGTGLGCGGGVEEFATAVPTDGNDPAMSAVYNEVTELRKVHAASRVESVNCKGVIALLLA